MDEITDVLSQSRSYWYVPFFITCLFLRVVVHINKVYLLDMHYSWERYKVHQSLTQKCEAMSLEDMSVLLRHFLIQVRDLRISQTASFLR